MNPFQFLKEVGQQIKQISWPDKKTVVKLSVTVIAISILSSLALGGFDLLFASTFANISKSQQDASRIQDPLDSAESSQATPSASP